MPKSWTSAEQKKWLRDRIDGFIEAQKAGSSGNWLTQTREAWFIEFPEREYCFPEKVGPLTVEENKTYNAAIETRKGQLETWFHYHSKIGKSSRRTAGISQLVKWITSVTKEVKRAPQERHVYRELFPERIDQLYAERVEGLPKAIDRCNMKASIASELYKEEPEEVKKKVREVVQSRKAELQEEIKKKAEAFIGQEERLPEDYQRSIDDMGGFLATCMEALVQATGWTFVILAGGPMPMKNGRLYTEHYHFGATTKEGGADFSQAHPNFKENVEDRFSNFIERCYSPEMCHNRALSPETPPTQKEGPKKASRKSDEVADQADIGETSFDDRFDGLIKMNHENPLISSPPPASPIIIESPKSATPSESNFVFDNDNANNGTPSTLPSLSPSRPSNPASASAIVPVTPERTSTEFGTYHHVAPTSPSTQYDTSLLPEKPASKPRTTSGGPTSPIENAFARMAQSAPPKLATNMENTRIIDSPRIAIIDPELLELDRPAPPSQTLESFNAGFIFNPLGRSLSSAGISGADGGQAVPEIGASFAPGISTAVDYTISRPTCTQQNHDSPQNPQMLPVGTLNRMQSGPHIMVDSAKPPTISYATTTHAGNELPSVSTNDQVTLTSDNGNKNRRGVKRKQGAANLGSTEVAGVARPRREIKAPIRPDGRPLSPHKVAKRGVSRT